MSQPQPEDLLEFQEILGHQFQMPELLLQALTHSSWRHETGGKGKDNETLEFFGDAVLEMIITEHLYNRYPAWTEGKLSKVRAAIVCSSTLAHHAGNLHFGRFLRLGKGEKKGGGQEKRSILANAFEAVVAAVYLDAGFGAARDFVLQRLREAIVQAAQTSVSVDFKSSLQVLSQRLLGCMPSYEVLSEEGPEHDKRFFVAVRLSGRFPNQGWGRSKKRAEQEAARKCWMELRELTRAESLPATESGPAAEEASAVS